MKRYRLHELFMPFTLMSRHFQAAVFFSLSVIGQYLSYTNISDSTSSLMRGVWRAASPLLHLSQHLSSHPLRLCTHPPTFSTSIFHLIISFIFSCTCSSLPCLHVSLLPLTLPNLLSCCQLPQGPYHL